MAIKYILPWCFTPGFYSDNTEFIEQIVGFIRTRPEQPVEAFIRQTEAILSHDMTVEVGKITAPTQLTFGQYDMITSVRFADAVTSAVPNTELVIFDDCAHAQLYQKTEEFNQKTLEFMRRHSERAKASSQIV